MLEDCCQASESTHLVIKVGGDMTIERGDFPFRLRMEFRYVGEVWQRGFSQVQVDDREGVTLRRTP